jgi:hypothetical protein
MGGSDPPEEGVPTTAMFTLHSDITTICDGMKNFAIPQYSTWYHPQNKCNFAQLC